MKYFLALFSDEAMWAKFTPAEQAAGLASYRAYVDALKQAGHFVSTDRLGPTSTATTIRTNGNGKQQVLDGPYVDTKEQFGGYFIIDVPDLDAAIAWAARCPAASHGAVELRPLWEMDGPA